MSELLKALQAAAAVGFDAPRCGKCPRHAVNEHGDCASWCRACLPDGPSPCPHCHATGLDASDPERLIGRALFCLHKRNEHVLLPWDTATVETVRINPENFMEYYGHDREAVAEREEVHDGTPTGLATALLRLVARVGGAA